MQGTKTATLSQRTVVYHPFLHPILIRKKIPWGTGAIEHYFTPSNIKTNHQHTTTLW